MENQKMMRKVNFWFELTVAFDLFIVILSVIGFLGTFFSGVLFLIFVITGLIRKEPKVIKAGIVVRGIAVLCLIVIAVVYIFIMKSAESKATMVIYIIVYSISFALNIKAYMCTKQNDYLKTQEGYPKFNQLSMEMKNTHFTEPEYKFDYTNKGSMEEIIPPEIK